MSTREELQRARLELLDLGLRNPLLNFRTTKARGLDIMDEIPEQVHRIFVEEGRVMSFLSAPEPEKQKDDLFGRACIRGRRVHGRPF